MAHARRAAEIAGHILVAPLVVLYRLRLGSFATYGQLLSVIPGFAGIFIRRAWYRSTLRRCGAAFTCSFGAMLHDAQAQIGDDCFVGKYSIVGLVEMGDDFMCGDQVQLLSGMRHHGFERTDVPIRSQGEPARSLIRIGEDVWVGAAAVVGADIAAHCVIAAGAVVAKPVTEPWLVVGGVPARTLRSRLSDVQQPLTAD